MSDRVRLALYSLAHFWVDLSCAFLLLRRLEDLPVFALGLLVYDFCAFALQMPLGLLADRTERCGTLAACGCVGAALAYLLPPFPAAVAAGVGNALFHLGGGVDVLRRSGGRAGALGVFVSPGALGLALGKRLAGTALPLWPGALGLLALAAVLGPLRRACPSGGGRHGGALWRVGPLFLVVVLRSYMGMNQAFPWQEGGWFFPLVLALVLGKAAGGFAMVRLGPRRASGWSLGAAAVLYLASALPLPGVAAVFLFNMTMPVTLWAAARLLPLGFSFGLLTFGLFLGFLPSFLGWPNGLEAGGPAAYAAVTLLSLALLLLGLGGGEGREPSC